MRDCVAEISGNDHSCPSREGSKVESMVLNLLMSTSGAFPGLL